MTRCRFVLVSLVACGTLLASCSSEPTPSASSASPGSESSATTTGSTVDLDHTQASSAPGHTTTAAAPSSPAVNAATVGSTGPPNILLVIADDMGVDASPCHAVGGTKAVMPNLAALCSAGVVFDNAWVNPECSPTRATILTGRYGFRTGVGAANAAIPLGEQSIQALIDERAPGRYSHAVVGKWHLANMANGGADNPNLMQVGHYVGDWNGIVDDFYAYDRYVDGKAEPLPGYVTTIETDDAIAWLGEQRSPWFLWLAYNTPHTPLHLPPADLHTDQSLTGTAGDIAARPLAYQQAALEALDHELGRVLASLSPAARAATVVIFVGDNGTAASVAQAPFTNRRAKGTVYQGGVNVPLVVAGAGVTRTGQREAALVTGVDLFATIADVAGTGVTARHDGISFRSLLGAAGPSPRSVAYTEFFRPARPGGGGGAGPAALANAWAVRDARYKLIQLVDGASSLYDLAVDPYEQNDLLLAPSPQAVAERDRLAAAATAIRSSG